MRNLIIVVALVSGMAGCSHQQEGMVQTPQVAGFGPSVGNSADATTPTTNAPKKLFLDVHEVGPGKVTAAAVSAAHLKDLALERKYDVELKAYWVDEKAGKIYCLAAAPSGQALNDLHREAHGLLANKVMEVTADNDQWQVAPGMKLFLDVHHFGAGKVDPAAVAAAHQKDLAAQGRHDVKYLNYWFDAETGTVMCLTQAPNAEAALAVHQEAHGLMPDAIEEVIEGR